MSLTRFLLAWRTIPLRDREVIDALVDPAHAGPSPELAQALESWRGSYYWSAEPDGRHLVLTHPAAPRPRERWVLHALLFAATLFTTTLGGAVLSGAVSMDLALSVRDWGALVLNGWSRGLSFSLPLLAILLCHELGHYLTALRYHLDIALPVLWIGLALSRPADVGVQGMTVWLGDGQQWQLGDSIVTLVLRRLVLGNAPGVVLHPAAVAGWFGMFVTALNLLPMAQLDGGHVLYAALPRRHEWFGRGFWAAIMLLGAFFWRGWLVWGTLVLVLSRGRLGHPPVLDVYRPLPPSRRWLAWASLVLFLATFTPMGIGP